MNLAALISGGKDSMLAMYRMHLEGHKIKYLLTMQPESSESYMFHHPNTWITQLISEAAQIPRVKGNTKGRKEEELADLKALFKEVAHDVDGIISGAIASRYQKTRIDSLCNELSLESFAPLWHVNPNDMWKELFKEDFTVMIVSVAAEGLDKNWLGKVIDTTAFEKLKVLSKKHRFHLGFEGGEAETLVLDMPMYKKRITVNSGNPTWDKTSGTYEIRDACLEEK